MFIAMPYLQSRRKGLFSLDHYKKVKEVEVAIEHFPHPHPTLFFFFSIRNIHTSSSCMFFNLESSEQLLVEYSIKKGGGFQSNELCGFFPPKQKAYSFVEKLKLLPAQNVSCAKKAFSLFLFCSLISIVSQQINTFYKIKFIFKITDFMASKFQPSSPERNLTLFCVFHTRQYLCSFASKIRIISLVLFHSNL